MPDVRIRPAEPNDLPACAAIINDYIDETEWLPRLVSREELTAIFEPGLLDKRHILVADDNGKIGGYLSLDLESGFVAALYLSPGYRCNGTGKLLLDAAKTTANKALELTVFEPNIHAQRFYHREGFSNVPEKYLNADQTEEGVPQLTMRWEAKAA